MSKNPGREYLKDFLLVAPLSHALWRSVEALSFGSEKIKDPVLDLGCGFGEFSGVVYGKLECGVDINKRDLKMALQGKKYKKVIEADARKLPFRAGKFSTVISVSVMEHIENTPKVISEVNRVLKKRGRFLLSVPTSVLYENLFFPLICEKVGFRSLGDFYKKLHKRVFNHVNIENIDWWVKKLQKSGFKVLKVEGTISSGLVRMHELFLLSAFPSQIWRWLFGKRLVIFKVRAKLLPYFFGRFVRTDGKSYSNVFIVAEKR